MATDWRKTDERLIQRGELILELGFVENYQTELDTMNRKKEGRPYKLTPTHHPVPHRLPNPLRSTLPPARRIHPQPPQTHTPATPRRLLRAQEAQPRSDPDPYMALRESDEPVTIAVDSTGVKVRLAGGWVERKYGKKKRYVKLHFAVDVETKEIVAMKVSTDDVHDVKAFPGLVKEANEKRRITCWLGDGAYDSGMVFEERGIEAVVKPRRNRVLGPGSSARGRAVREFQERGYEGWAVEKGYGRRWAVETAFSTFKRMFGEHSLARTMDNITRELVAKVSLYNMLVNM